VAGEDVPHPFVADEKSGVWGNAIVVKNSLGRPLNGSPSVVSCRSAGNCVAGGSSYSSPLGAYLVEEKNGVWGKAKGVPGIAALGHGASVNSISCPSAGFCAAGGTYYDAHGHRQVFLVDEKNGVWGKPKKVTGTWTAFSRSHYVDLTQVSCASAGFCAAGGTYHEFPTAHSQAFVVDEKNGVLGYAKSVPGTVALNLGYNAVVSSVSCGGKGNCAGVGYYTDASKHHHSFVANETGGVWRKATEVGMAGLRIVSCWSPGNCAAGGSQWDTSGHSDAFVVDETNGVWQSVIETPGIAALDGGAPSVFGSVSCARSGHCAAGGGYYDGSEPAITYAFVTAP
jgi:hypothetical protein